MKRFLFCAVLVIIFNAFFAECNYAKNGPSIYTDDRWRNGYSFTDIQRESLQNSAHNLYGYVQGVVEGLEHSKLVPKDLSKMNVFDDLMGFYMDHPKERSRPIIEVVLERYGNRAPAEGAKS